jgi:DHA2 family multidrug resistance protein-like MFS transporter
MHSTPTHHDGLPPPRRYWAMLAVGLTLVTSVIDHSMISVALPTIAADLDADPAFSIWIVNAYQVAIMISLLPLAALGEIVGYSRVYLGGLVVFAFASLASSLADSMPTLMAARVLQGLGASGLMSVNMAVVRFIYPANMLGRGIGLNAVIIAVSAAAGPTIASAILAVESWRSLFGVNVPITLIALAIGVWALPPSPRARRPFDFISALLTAIVLGLFIMLIDSPGRDIPRHLIFAEIGTMIIAAAFLVRRQMWTTAPLLPVDLLRIPLFALSIGTSICSFVAQGMALIVLPFYLQTNLGYSAVETGLLMTPWPLATSVVAPISGRLSDRHAPGLFGLVGLLLFAAGLALMAMLPRDASVFDIAWRMALLGIGFGIYQPPNNRAMITSAPRERSGGAAGMQGMARLIGQTVGAAIGALLFGVLMLETATVAAQWVCVGFAVVGALVSALRLKEFATPPSR